MGAHHGMNKTRNKLLLNDSTIKRYSGLYGFYRDVLRKGVLVLLKVDLMKGAKRLDLEKIRIAGILEDFI